MALIAYRKYLSKREIIEFFKIASYRDFETYVFCLFLAETGCRISEALSSTRSQLDISENYIYIETLKRRRRGIIRRIPLLPSTVKLLLELYEQKGNTVANYDGRFWIWSRMTAYRRVRDIMLQAGIVAPNACPKSLRHSFAVTALEAGVPVTLVQRWLGHAHWKTTAIYIDLQGNEERKFAKEMWKHIARIHRHPT